MMGYFSKIGEQTGWHHVDRMGVNGAFGARSDRTPEPRFSSSQYPYRTTCGRVEQMLPVTTSFNGPMVEA